MFLKFEIYILEYARKFGSYEIRELRGCITRLYERDELVHIHVLWKMLKFTDIRNAWDFRTRKGENRSIHMGNTE